MANMFTCSDGTMFPINEILSVQEADLSFHVNGVGTRTPITLSSANEALSIAKRHYIGSYEESAFGRAIRHFFVRLFRKSISESDTSQKRYAESMSEFSVKEDLSRFKQGERVLWGTEYYALKRWDVRIRNKKYTIRISHEDYMKLQNSMLRK